MQVSRHGTVRTFSVSSGWSSSFTVPDFSCKAMEALEKKEVTKGVRSEIVNVVAYEIWRYTQFPKSEDYNSVCLAVVNKYPILKDTIGTPFVSKNNY